MPNGSAAVRTARRSGVSAPRGPARYVETWCTPLFTTCATPPVNTMPRGPSGVSVEATCSSTPPASIANTEMVPEFPLVTYSVSRLIRFPSGRRDVHVTLRCSNPLAGLRGRLLDDLERPRLRVRGRRPAPGAVGVLHRGPHPRLEVLLAAPAGVDEVLVGALDRAEQVEPLEAVGALHHAGAGREPLFERLPHFRRDRQRVDLHDAHAPILAAEPRPDRRWPERVARPPQNPIDSSVGRSAGGPGRRGGAARTRRFRPERPYPGPNRSRCPGPVGQHGRHGLRPGAGAVAPLLRGSGTAG